jgi:transglutaminase-like putative cysteine protease
VLIAWAGVMASVINRSYLQASANLATDLARYGSTAQWRGVYYRGEKLGFSVSQTVPLDSDDPAKAGFELQEDAELQMALLGATTPAKIRTTARVNRAFELQAFDFSLDPGTGPIKVSGTVNGRTLVISVTSAGSTRSETRELAEPPMLSLNLARRLAGAGLIAGKQYQWSVFDPATLRNAPITVRVGSRELIRAANMPIPAFRVDMEFVGLRTTSWVTDTGEVVREESPMGIISVRETPERARALAVPGQMRKDLLQASAVVPIMAPHTPRLPPLVEPRDVRRLLLRVEGADLSSPDLQGTGQSVTGDIVEIQDEQHATAERGDRDLARYLAPELFIESDAPEIRAEAQKAVHGIRGTRPRAEALTRYVNAIIRKKPTVSLPSAREVLRTKIGDCNEHTALFVAMSRAIGIPARVAVGLAFAHGAFYYHAWPEVYIDEGGNRGLWLPVDPTFNQFPADSTHLRLARGGLDKQTAIIPFIGRVKITVLELELAPDATPILVGHATPTAAEMYVPPQPTRARWCLPCFLGGHK